jgi:hypothetical protein
MRFDFAPLFLSCYDGEDAAAQAAAAEAAKAAAAKVADAAKDVVTKDQVEKLLADERKKAEAKLKVVLADKEATLTELLATKTLTEQQRTEYEAKLDDVQKQLHSEKELLLKEKKKVEEQLGGKLKEADQKAKDWEGRFAASTIQRELQEAAVKGEAINPKQIVLLLKPATKIVEADGEYKTVVEIEDMVDGKLTTIQCSPEEAVTKMKAQVEAYGNLFKTPAVNGLGKAASEKKVDAGKIDWGNLSHEEYMKLRPTLLKK